MTKKERLNYAKRELKKQFRGIEPQIDQIINSITSWYLSPDKQARVQIVNIWGLTGTGKSSLIRALVGYLGLNNKYKEITIASETRGNNSTDTIHWELRDSNITTKDQAVLFLDEFQRYRTINQGEPVPNLNYPDLWTLLSDGRLLSPEQCLERLKELRRDVEDSKRNLCKETFLFKQGKKSKKKTTSPKTTEKVTMDDVDKAIDEEEEQMRGSYDFSEEPDYVLAPQESKGAPVEGYLNNRDSFMASPEFAKLFSLPLQELLNLRAEMNMPEARFDKYNWDYKIKSWADAFNKTASHTITKDQISGGLTYEDIIEKVISEIDYFTSSNVEKDLQFNKLLVIIAGNQDKLYSHSDAIYLTYKDVEDVYEDTKEYKWYQLKSILLKTLAPEHISRLGMTHILYPSLSEKAYKQVLNDRLSKLSEDVVKNYGIKVAFTENAKEMLYKNGVFPTQGVRPLLAIIDSVMNNIVLSYLVTTRVKKDFIIDIDRKKNQVLANGKKIADIVLEVTEKEDTLHAEDRMLSAVHEAGHGIIHMYCVDRAMSIDMAPLAPWAGAWTRTKLDKDTRETISMLLAYIEADITCALGGKAAEEVVFGDTNRSWGCYTDMAVATEMAMEMARRVTASGNMAVSTVASNMFGSNLVTSTSEQIDAWTENLLKSKFAEAKEILVKCKPVLIKMVDHLMKEPYLSNKECQPFLQEIRKIRKSGKISTIGDHSYTKLWKGFTKKK